MRRNWMLSLLILFAFAACSAQFPTTRPEAKPLRPPVAAPQPSNESVRIAAYYAAVQARLISQGKLRQDAAPSDAIFNKQDLIRNFIQIALHDEYSLKNGRFIHQKTESQLRKWTSPVRIGIEFGPSVSKEQRVKDTKNVRFFAQRLARLTGLDIQLAKAEKPNFLVLFLNRDEQVHYAPALARKMPGLLDPVLPEISNSSRGTFCAAYAFSDKANQNTYTGAVILIKSEHKSVMRSSCIQEEMAQALGLANDSPNARPSIFNDDEEFALLTYHDELLLKMLYDPRLRLGMTPHTALPYLDAVAQDAMSQGNS